MFARRGSDGSSAVMPFVVAGHPALPQLGPILRGLERGGADAVEIGIPFSDPIADGPLIAAAMHDALELGVTVDGILSEVRTIRPSLEMPILAMVSISIVDRLGRTDFVASLASAGFDGLIVPDADLNVVVPLVEAAKSHDLAFSTLLAPDTARERAIVIASMAREFIYLLARKGLTGEHRDAPDLRDRIAEIREITDLPLAAGFGISTPEHVKSVVRDADAAIIGSALVRAINDAARSGDDLGDAAMDFISPMASAAHGEQGASGSGRVHID
ncbi:MAG: tryptophan synthase subunit alpha [Planctomycetota bacterium]|nr:tryptophan synthase subunit alpha [Planctomycetota bacterium]